MHNRLKNLDISDGTIIAENIKKLMDTRNLSELHLARDLGLSVMTIRRVISGETGDPRISTLSLIADYFKVSVDFLRQSCSMPFAIMKYNKPFFLPIFDWSNLTKKNQLDLSLWKKWYPIVNTETLNLSTNSFALESKPSLSPKFPKGSLLIINPDESMVDGDILLIKFANTENFSLRELIIDPPKMILKPVISESEVLFYNEQDHNIVGVLVLTILHQRD